MVTELDRFVYAKRDPEGLLAKINGYTLGDSTFDTKHIREGVVCRIEHPEIPVSIQALKYKSFWFCELEGVKKNDDTYVDIEEIS